MAEVLDWRAAVRSGQTFLPRWAHELRLDAQQWVRQALKSPHEEEFRALAYLLPGDALCLDVGANRGQSIDSMRAVMGSDLEIVAFEPQSRLATRLRERYPDVCVHRCGLGDRWGTHTIYIPSYRGYVFDGLASCDPSDAVAWFPTAIRNYKPGLVSVERETCMIDHLDAFTFPRKVNFIKFDVQGYELRALQGAERHLRKEQPLLMIETPNHEVCEYLASLGYYQCWWYNGVLTDVEPPEFVVNSFFIV